MTGNQTKLKDVDAERAVLAGVLKDVGNIDKAMLNCNPTYFTEALYRNLFKIATQAYTRYGSLLTHDFLSNVLEANGYPQDVRLTYLKAIDDLAKVEVNNAEFGFALTSLRRAFISSSVSDILTSGTQALEAKGGQRAFEVLDKKLYDLKLHTVENNSLVLQDDRQVDDLIDLLRDIRENPEKHLGIGTGLTTLDQLTGGFHPGEYVLLIAKSGGGKSIGLLNWATFAQKSGYNVVYVTLEMSHVEIRLRKLSLESGIPYLSLKTQNLTVEQIALQEKVLREEIATRTSAFHIVDISKCSVGFIEAQLRQLQQNIKIDVVVVDYLGLLKPEGYVTNKQGWEVYASISNDLRELARNMKLVVVSAHQLTTDGMKKSAEDDLELEDIALSRRIADPAHTVVGLIWDKTNPSSMKLCVPKCRNGRIASAVISCDLNTCHIMDPIEGVVTDDGNLCIPDPEL
jgi:replicative DNA helicase